MLVFFPPTRICFHASKIALVMPLVGTVLMKFLNDVPWKEKFHRGISVKKDSTVWFLFWLSYSCLKMRRHYSINTLFTVKVLMKMCTKSLPGPCSLKARSNGFNKYRYIMYIVIIKQLFLFKLHVSC